MFFYAKTSGSIFDNEGNSPEKAREFIKEIEDAIFGVSQDGRIRTTRLESLTVPVVDARTRRRRRQFLAPVMDELK